MTARPSTAGSRTRDDLCEVDVRFEVEFARQGLYDLELRGAVGADAEVHAAVQTANARANDSSHEWRPREDAIAAVRLRTGQDAADRSQ